MPQGSPNLKPPDFYIIETTRFEKAARTLLTPLEYRGLHLLLADNPLCGTPVSGLDGLMKLPHAGCSVFYSVASSLQTIFLLFIERSDSESPPPNTEQTKAVRTALQALTRIAVIVAIRKGFKWLWELVKENFFL